ncbi:gluconokinase [Caldimonas sp.]|uniref:gluconokinase n=1 Tax=Caldimonas sp. TaxID=2838790 RepID=UPI00391DC967
MDSATKSTSSPAAAALVVMGVAGCGKSSLGRACAEALAWPLLEGDDYHSHESVAKMKAGIALTDADREGWLARLGQMLAERPQGAVLTCSALRQRYRDQLRAARPGLHFAFLDLDEATARERVAARAGHLFPPSLVASQFATLESPVGEPGVLHLDATLPLERLRDQVLAWLRHSTETPA